MDWMELLARLSDSLAWPITTLAAIILLKEKLGALLPRLEKFKHKDTEFSFAKAMEAVIESAEDAEGEIIAISLDLKAEEGRLLDVLDIAPNRVIHQAYNLVDIELVKIDNLLSTEERKPITVGEGRKVRDKAGVAPELETMIKNLQRVRTSVMNNRKTLVAREQAVSFVELSVYVAAKLREFIANKLSKRDAVTGAPS